MPLLIFIHIPKTGGSTLSDILRANYARDRTFDHESYDRVMQPLSTLAEAVKPKIELVMGHYDHGIHESFPGREALYFTMLRDPVERVLSHYSFVRTYPGYEGIAHGKSFSEYLDLSEEATNGQTYQLAGFEAGRNLELAKRNLESCVAVGTTERFDESLRIMQRRFGWKNIAYKSINITGARLRREELSAAQLRRVEEMNALDMELYAYADTLLSKALAMS